MGERDRILEKEMERWLERKFYGLVLRDKSCRIFSKNTQKQRDR
jgi:hypothetical protein